MKLYHLEFIIYCCWRNAHSCQITCAQVSHYRVYKMRTVSIHPLNNFVTLFNVVKNKHFKFKFKI